MGDDFVTLGAAIAVFNVVLALVRAPTEVGGQIRTVR